VNVSISTGAKGITEHVTCELRRTDLEENVMHAPIVPGCNVRLHYPGMSITGFNGRDLMPNVVFQKGLVISVVGNVVHVMW
jgi:hypothetical protein